MKQNLEDCDANEQSIAHPMLLVFAEIRSNQPFRQNVRLFNKQWERARPISRIKLWVNCQDMTCHKRFRSNVELPRSSMFKETSSGPLLKIIN
jgi:hypothetical protein